MATDTIDRLRSILMTNMEIEVEALEILQRINLEINQMTIISTTSQNLDIEIQTEIESKLTGILQLIFYFTQELKILTAQPNLYFKFIKRKYLSLTWN